MACELEIIVKPRDHRGKHFVEARHSGSVHVHRFDVEDQGERKRFRETVVTRFNLDEDSHGWIEDRLLAGAEQSSALFKPVITMLDTVPPQKVEWLWQKRIAIGKNNLLCGDPGLGKSLLALDIAARVSRGECFLDASDIEQLPGGVIILTLEDDAADTLVPRLLAHNADLSRIAHVQGLSEIDSDGKAIHGIDLLHDIQSVRAAIEQVENCKLLIVDTISDYLGEKTDSHKNRDTRAVLNPMAALASECRVANLIISHLRKGEGRAIHAAMGSVGFVGQCRVAWMVTRCPTNQRRRLMTSMKNNLADDTSGLAFSIEPHGPDSGPVLCWEAEPVRMSAEEAMAQQKQPPGRKPQSREAAATWLSKQLASGPKPAGDILDDADAEGFTVRTVRRALDQLGGKRSKDGFNGGWVWSLPEDDTEGDTQHHTESIGPFATFEETKERRRLSNCSRAKGTDSVGAVGTDTFDEFERERVSSNGHGDVPF